ncbi:putative phage abortive infection protein [Winogradskyella thalassocola]|uniref:Putative phage abortive infection protein n=1 Tax=Winogradskyella thalassocola TaxID=262004 RepID=A0A1G7ZMA6_9FLAO|nr:putative phage abortive infection protein [Winogradskyella thalassocola]SDH09882.1 Putative phage abortive infection protein [Winogradskyella thalassocola]
MVLFISVFIVLAIVSFFVSVFLVFDKYNTYGFKLFKNNSKIIIFSLFLTSICSILLVFALYKTDFLLNNADRIKTDYSNIGAYGDLIGGILNPVVAFIGIIAASLAFYVQYKANTQVQKQFQIQQFESQFYKMLDLHKENITEMKVTFFDHITSEDFKIETNEKIESAKTLHSSEIFRSVEGRKLFHGMVGELEAIIQVVIEESNKYLGKDVSNYPNIYEHLLNYAYRIFFFGLGSEQASIRSYFQMIEAETIFHLLRIQKKFYERHKLGAVNRQSGHQFSFYPFEGHESRLSHYYRNLYAIVKMITAKHNGEYGTKDYFIARNYLKILRAQLSNSEQHLLYLNYRIGFGKDWNSIKPRNTNYLTTYRMIHNIPVDRITIPESPRKHFEAYIKGNEVSRKDTLFEWGDYD